MQFNFLLIGVIIYQRLKRTLLYFVIIKPSAPNDAMVLNICLFAPKDAKIMISDESKGISYKRKERNLWNLFTHIFSLHYLLEGFQAVTGECTPNILDFSTVQFIIHVKYIGSTGIFELDRGLMINKDWVQLLRLSMGTIYVMKPTIRFLWPFSWYITNTEIFSSTSINVNNLK